MLKREGRAGLVTYLTCGDPDAASFAKMLEGLPQAGADLIEVGMPFSDPMADGPAIQAAGLRALKAGMTLAKVLAIVGAFRKTDQATPIVLMGYYNPIYHYGVAKFLADAKAAGVDGLIVVDLPPEHDEELCIPAERRGLDFIRLATPTTDDKRLPQVLKNTQGFLYYVAVAGVTGTKSASRRCHHGGGGAAETPHRSAGRRRLRHPHAGASRCGRARRRCRRGRLRFGRARCRIARWQRQGDARRLSARCSADVRALAHGVKGARASAKINP